VPVLVGDQVKCFRFWTALSEAGVFANPVIPPAVEPGHALLRTSYMATHTDAQLDRAPVVALTGQAALSRVFKESHQYLDVMGMFRPITKWNARVELPETLPEIVRKAFRLARLEKPGATHIELPEDIMEMDVAGEPLPRRRPPLPEPSARELLKAADIIRGALNPVALAGNGVIRAGAAPALREFSRQTGIPIATSFMGKGAVDAADPSSWLGTVGLQSGDYRMAGFEQADVIIAIDQEAPLRRRAGGRPPGS